MKSPFTVPKIKRVEKRQANSLNEFAKLKKRGWRIANRNKLIVKRKKPMWRLFEEELFLFFKDALRLEDVHLRKRLGRNEIDVTGGIKNVLLLIDCKTKEEPGFKNLRNYITTLAGKRGTIRKSVEREYGRKYSKIIFILALRDIDFGADDETYARDSGVFLWGEKYIDILQDLYTILGPDSKHYFLKELGLGPFRIKSDGSNRYYLVPALRLGQKDVTIYNFFLEADKLLKLCYVARVETASPDAYQRLVSKNRLSRVSDFIMNGGQFRNNIIVGIDGKTPKPQAITSIGRDNSDNKLDIVKLRISKEYLSLWVIDGQHRLYGFSYCPDSYKKAFLPVTIIQDAHKAEQAQTFVDINHEQKPVDSSLLWQLFGTLRPNTEEGIISSVVKNLASSRTTIFRGKIYVPGVSRRSRKSYKIFFSNFCKGIMDRKIFDKKIPFSLYHDLRNSIDDSSLLKAKQTIDMFFKVACRIAVASGKKGWIDRFILTNNGLNVFLRVFYHCLEHFDGKMTNKRVRQLLTSPLKKYFRDNYNQIDDLRKRTSSEGTREDVSATIVDMIHRSDSSFAHHYVVGKLKALTHNDAYKALLSMEKKLRKFLVRELSKVTVNWWKERVPEDVRTRAEENLNRHRSPFIMEKPRTAIDCLDFMDYPKIITRADNWREVFQRYFQDEDIIWGRFKEMKQVRTKIAHPVDLSEDEKSDFIKFCRKVERAISSKQTSRVKRKAA